MTKDEEIVKRVFKELGIDADDINQIREARKNLEWAGENRKRCKTIVGKIVVYAVLIVTGGTLALLWEGIRTKFGIGK